jgi:hypothetical protein
MHELVQTDPATTSNKRTGLVQCRYLIDKGIAALIPTENQSRTIRVPPINAAPRKSCPTAHDERRRKQPHSDEAESVRDFHPAQDAAKVSCQCNDEGSDK